METQADAANRMGGRRENVARKIVKDRAFSVEIRVPISLSGGTRDPKLQRYEVALA